MPRLARSDNERKVQSTGRWVLGKMREQGITQEHLSNKLGITQQAIGQKIKKSSFTQRDLIVIFKEINATDKEIVERMRI